MDTGSGYVPSESCQLWLKIMRLARPSFYGSPVVEVGDDWDGEGVLGVAGVAGVDGQLPCDVTRVRDLPHVQSGELLLLPKSFGDIHLGETFACYVSVFNSGTSAVHVLSVSSELQTEVRRRALAPAPGSALPATCGPRQHVGTVFRHEVTEVGSHMLVCTVTYSEQGEGGGERRSFNQRFKFESNKPLDLKTKFRLSAADSDQDDGAKVRLETTITNTSPLPMFLERVSLEPSAHFSLVGAGPEPGGLQLAPRDIVQFVFQLASMKRGSQSAEASTVVGKLDIQWRRALGLKGRLQSSPLVWQPVARQPSELELHVLEAPGAVPRLQPLTLECEVRNRGSRLLSLLLSLQEHGDVVWRGKNGHHVARLAPGESTSFSLQLELRRSGLHCIGGVTLIDTALGLQFPFNQLTEILAL